MWLFTTFGFFSIVQKTGDAHLTVRARVAADLDALRERYLPALGPVVEHAGTDYPYRARVPRDDLAAAVAAITTDLAYPNFKDAVAKDAGHARASVYHQVWAALMALEKFPAGPVKEAPTAHQQPPSAPGLKPAFGGVVFDHQGRVLLREPMGHFDDYVWTFAKGRPDSGETPEACALREVLEETGIEARIECEIPGAFDGGTTRNRYFLMTLVKQTEAALDETAAVRWFTPEQAPEWIRMTTNPTGRQRDLAVLKAALQVREGFNQD